MENENLLGKPSGIISIFGTYSLLVFLILFPIVLSIIPSPDYIIVESEILSENYPTTVKSPRTATIEKIYVSDKQKILYKDIIVSFVSSAKTDDVLLLENSLLEFFKSNLNSKLNLDHDLSLGSVNESFQEFRIKYSNYLYVKEQNRLEFQRKSLLERVQSIEEINGKLSRQLEYQNKITSNYNALYQSDSILDVEKVIAKNDKIKSENDFLSQKLNSTEIERTILENNLSIQGAREDFKILELSVQEKLMTARIELETQLIRVIESIDEWKLQNLLMAENPGIITSLKPYRKGQNVDLSEDLFLIVPEETSKLFANCLIPSSQFEGLDRNLKVKIEISGFPSSRYGFIETTITEVTGFSFSKNRIATVIVPSDLTTTMGYSIAYYQNMPATFKIIKNEYTLLEKLFFGFRGQIYK